jgi:hypothetical protein
MNWDNFIRPLPGVGKFNGNPHAVQIGGIVEKTIKFYKEIRTNEKTDDSFFNRERTSVHGMRKPQDQLRYRLGA